MAIAYDPDIAQTIWRVGQNMNVSDDVMQAAFAAALVESNMRNLRHGDRDSQGVFQQRPSQGWGTVEQVTDPEYAARKFFQAAKQVDDYSSPGDLAQQVQRSAYPGRYDQRLDDALTILARMNGRRPEQAGRSAGLNQDDDNLEEDDHTDLLTSILQSMSAKIRGTTDPTETPEQRQVEQATGAFGDSGAEADAEAVGMDTRMNEVGDTDTGTRARSDVNWAPGQWGGYHNGKIPKGALAAVKGVHYSGQATHYFEPTAAKQFRAMVRAAKRDGVNITLTDSYRDYQTQVRLKDEKGGMAATPGFSNHGWGKAVDVANGREWITRNGAKYGWVLPTWARPGGSNPEPWHFEWGGES